MPVSARVATQATGCWISRCRSAAAEASEANAAKMRTWPTAWINGGMRREPAIMPTQKPAATRPTSEAEKPIASARTASSVPWSALPACSAP